MTDAGIALNRRHGLEGKGAAISVGVLAAQHMPPLGWWVMAYLFINVIQCVFTRLPDLCPKSGC
jgi:hypothetical protein